MPNFQPNQYTRITRSLNNKLPELSSLLPSSQFNVLCITEAWLHPSTADSVLLDGTNYSIFRADRSISHYGGVCILINNNRVKATDVPLPPKFSHLELRVIDLYGVEKFACLFAIGHLVIIKSCSYSISE